MENRVNVQTMTEGSSSKAPLAIIKFLELCLTGVCVVLDYYSFGDGDMITCFLATGTFCGFSVILVSVLAGYMMEAPVNKRINLFYSIIGSGAFITTGIFVIRLWEEAVRSRTRDLGITKGTVSIINGVIFVMDTLLTFRQKK